MKLDMVLIQIVGLKSQLLNCLYALQKLGCVHIDPVDTVPQISAHHMTLDQDLLNQQEQLRMLLAQVEGLINALAIGDKADNRQPASGPRVRAAELTEEISAGISELTPPVQKLVYRREELEAELDSLPRYEATLRKLLPIVPDSAHARGNLAIALLINREHIGVLDRIRKEALRITSGHADAVVGNIDETTRALLIVFAERYADQIQSLVGHEDVSRFRLPAEFEEKPLEDTLAEMQGRLSSIPGEIDALIRETETLAGQWRARLIFWRTVLRDELSTYDVVSRLGETDMTFVIAGWVARKDLERVRSAIHACSESAMVSELALTPETRARMPVKLENPWPAQSFESLVRLRALPGQGDIDPSRLMALFLPLFFGMILGDAGYGAVLLALSLMARRWFKTGMLRDLRQVLMLGAGWAIVFGILFGEVFGTLGEQFGLHPLWFHRASPEHITSLLYMAIGVGAVHIALGLIIGVFEAIQEKSRNHLLERGGMLVGLVALFLLVGVLVDILPPGLMTPAVAGVIVGVVLLGASLGWLGILLAPIEFISLIGNVLSYLRIAAIGLASVFLAIVANEIAGVVGSLIVGIIIATLIHALNIVLGAFSPTIHSLRLHYVEFFRKFFEGGGRPFQPFTSQVE